MLRLQSGAWGRARWLGVFVGALTLLAFARAGHTQTVNWTHTQIANVDGGMPSIEVDRLGYVHVGWTLNMGGASYYAYHVTNASGDYARTLVDSKTTGSPDPYFPFLTTDSLGFFHMVWRELSLTGRPVFYRTNNPDTRAMVKMSFNSSGHTHDPIADVTSDNIAHVITEADSCTGCASGSNLYDESFTSSALYAGRVTTLVNDLKDATGMQQFSSAAGPDGTRHLVFGMRLAPPADNQRLIYYSSRAPGSLTWSEPVSITGHQDNYQGWPGIVIDMAGTLHVVYSSEDNGIYYVKKPTGGAWSVPLRINDQNAVMDAIPSIAIDPNGRLHVVFQRYTPVTGKPAVISLHYTTNAFDENNWLEPAPEILTNVGTFTLTHQNRKVAVNWVDGQVLVPYQSANSIWLASTSDVPVTPNVPNGTSTLTALGGFTPPTTLNRTLSNTAGTATSVMKFTITDGGGDSAATQISSIHVNAATAQSYTVVLGKDEGLAYLLGGAQLVTGAGQIIPGVVSDKKMVFKDVSHALWIPSGGSQTFDLQIWMKNQAYATGKTIDLRIKPDQDVVTEAAGSKMAVDEPIVETQGMPIVDNNASCPTGTACNDGNPCTYNDMCNNSNVCTGVTVTCNSDPCNTRTCNGSGTCTTTPVSCGGGTGGSGGAGGRSTGGSGMGGMGGRGGMGGAVGAGSGGGPTGGAPSGGAPGSTGGIQGSGGATGTGGMVATGGTSNPGSGGDLSIGGMSGFGGFGGMASGELSTGGTSVAASGGMPGMGQSGGAFGNGGASTGGIGSSGTGGAGSGNVLVDAGASGGRGADAASAANAGASGCACDVDVGGRHDRSALSIGGLWLALLSVSRRRRRSAPTGHHQVQRVGASLPPRNFLP